MTVVVLAGVALAVAGYGAGVLQLTRSGVDWPAGRVLALVLGGALVVVGSLPALTGHGPPTRAAVVGHLLATMAGPLLVALGAPVTLALRALPRRPARGVLAALHTAPARLLVRAPVVTVLVAASVAAAWLAPVPHGLHGLLHLHMVLGGLLLAVVVTGVDPVRRDLSTPARLVVVVVTGAAHDVVARLAWARAPLGSTGDEARAATELLATGGHLLDAALALVVVSAWYRRAGRRLAAAERRRAASPAQDAAGLGGDRVEAPAVQGGALPADVVRVDPQHPVQPHLAGPALPVPAAGPDVDPVPALPGLVGGVPVVVLAGQHEPEQVRPGPAHDEHRAVLAPAVALLVGDPRPDDLARVGPAVVAGGVGDLAAAGEVAGAARGRAGQVGVAGSVPQGGPGAVGGGARGPAGARGGPPAQLRPALADQGADDAVEHGLPARRHARRR